MKKEETQTIEQVEKRAKISTNGVVSREQGELTRKWLFGEITDAEYKLLKTKSK